MDTLSLIRLGYLTARRDWKRSTWLMAGVALGLAFYLAVSTIGASYAELVKLPFARLESDLIIQHGVEGSSSPDTADRAIRLPFSNRAIDSEAITTIRNLPAIKKLSTATVLWYQEHKKFITITGVDPANSASGPSKVMEWISQGRALLATGEAVIESHYARFNRLKVGDVVYFDQRPFTIVGKADIKEGASLAAANFYISNQDAVALGGLADDTANLLSATLIPGADKKGVTETINKLLPGAIVSSSDSISDMMQGFGRISTTSSMLLSSVALGFTMLLTVWLMAARQQEQAWKIGLMQTLGWQKRDIVFSSGTEALAQTALGGAVGMILGLLIIMWMGSLEVSLTLPWNLAATPETMHHAAARNRTMQVALPVSLEPWRFLMGFVLSCLAATAMGAWSALYLARKTIRQTLLEM